MASLRIALASDHAGFPLKQKLSAWLTQQGHAVEDFGCRSEEAADLSDHAAPAAEALSLGRVDRALFVDGAGYPSGIIANMYHGVFAAVCNDPVSAKLSREHGDSNALCIGAMIVGQLMAQEILRVFLASEPQPGKYAARRAKVAALGAKHRVATTARPRQVITVADVREAILEKKPLLIDADTVITPSVIDGVKGMKA